jgi:hypothetical protein
VSYLFSIWDSLVRVIETGESLYSRFASFAFFAVNNSLIELRTPKAVRSIQLAEE